ncbi:M48 family metallopeptidase [Pseudoxanthomonas daejeonensis]|uniref:Zn-dependent protease with chaperone function n=1 Tax=Pseudoxanthomonas daejeonensis TaxID=266062 RepID=A0ABQ6Z9Q7_9GAMM|nr:M48 family metallopeptidase [Pseudoxanthomonas daejeonensis]KAF1695918.1 Zn-dependent protease with chaperone function [Pseudoxanthomonas daejeonensis]
MESLYPAGPVSVPDGLTLPSKTYRRQAWLAVAGLLGFIAAYLGLLSWFAWTSFRLFKGMVEPGSSGLDLLTLLAAFAAGLLAVFMAKALVFRRRAQVPAGRVELTAAQQPELFAFLHRLADEAGAPRPHRVYLSAQVNACVFYDLSVANLLLPSRKNLEIGLALVNVLNLGELKAVLAHEFGHFAQRSMAVGRWVYVAQQIANEIVQRRDALDRLLAALSRFDLRVAWIGWGLSLVVWSIRSLADLAFRGVSLAQRALSREMEYQADLVAASLTGSDALVHALHRLGAADEAWNRALSFASDELRQGRSVQDLFAIQARVIEHLQIVLDDPGYGRSPELPAAAREGHRLFVAELAPPPQMWSTHPSNTAREASIKRRYVACEIDQRPALDLFRDGTQLKVQLSQGLFRGELPEAPPMETSLVSLDRGYAALSMSRRYRGSYLGRSIVRAHSRPQDLYIEVGSDDGLLERIDTLYPASLGGEIEQLRELRQQRAALEAIQQGRYRTEGDALHWRGMRMSRKDLPRILAEIDAELGPVQARVTHHDQLCRSLHRRASLALRQDWTGQLEGALRVLHYAEHAGAELADAYGLLGNTYQVVAADGRVSSSELRRLVASCNDLHRSLQRIHDQAGQVRLDEVMARELDGQAWPDVIGKDFSLPMAGESNISQWMKAIDSWHRPVSDGLSRLAHAALESLLASEDQVARQLRGGTDEVTVSAAAASPSEYPTLLPGGGRRLQHRLGWLDRFHTADGWLAGGTRLVVAAAIVVAVLVAGGAVGLSQVTVFNGLDRTVEVEIDGQRATIGPARTASMRLPNKTAHEVSAYLADGGALIEHFSGEAPNGSPHLAYNIGAAAPLVEWTASYGNAREVAPRQLGTVRWTTTRVDHVFSEPPETVSTKTGGDTRRVLSGMSGESPRQMLAATRSDAEAKAMIAAHATWDDADSRHLRRWMWHAKEAGILPEVLRSRLDRAPREIVSLRMEQDESEGTATHDAVCERHRSLAGSAADSSALQYLAIRCLTDPQARDDAFLAGYQRWPKEPWLAMAAGYVHSERQEWDQALDLFRQAARNPMLAEDASIEMARMRRASSDEPVDLGDLAKRSDYVSTMLALESGDGTEGTPMAAYRYLAGGDLPAAMGIAVNDAESSGRMLRLAAASDGASRELVTRALALPLQDGLDDATAWATFALASREGRDTTALREAALATDPEQGEAIARFLDALRSGADAATAEQRLGNVGLRTRGIAYSSAAVLMGTRCPATWREGAKSLLFVAERPYLS